MNEPSKKSRSVWQILHERLKINKNPLLIHTGIKKWITKSSPMLFHFMIMHMKITGGCRYIGYPYFCIGDAIAYTKVIIKYE